MGALGSRALAEGLVPEWVEQIDFSDAQTKSDIAKIADLMKSRFAILLRNCEFTKDSLLEFSAQLGTPMQRANVSAVIELIPRVENTNRASTFSSVTPMQWHSDRSFEENYPTFSILFAKDFGPGAGATVYANNHLAYMRLSSEMKNKLNGLKCRHELKKFSDGYEDTIYKFKSPQHQEIAFRRAQSLKDVVQYWNGLPYLCINRGYTSEIIGEDPALLEQLLTMTEDPTHIYTHQWQTGDLFITNNRVLIHSRAASSGTQRTSYRVLLV